MVLSLVFLFCHFNALAQDFSEPPIVTNSINAVRLSELNLTSSDYSLMNTITETSIVSVSYSRRGFTITGEDESFVLKYKYIKKGDDWHTELVDWSGTVKLGYLSNDTDLYVPKRAADVAKRLAIHRLIARAQQMGADGIVEPIVSMNMATNGKQDYFKTTVSGKLIVLKVQ